MADWIHCNKCSHRFTSNIKFYVRECSHLECQTCSKQTVGELDGKCATCGKICKRILICPSMKPEMQLYFRPFSQYLDKSKEVYEYQQRQQSNLCKQLTAKYHHAKTEVLKAYRLIDMLKNDISILKSGGQISEEHAQHYATSTPIMKDAPLSVLNASLSTVANNHNYSGANSSPGIYSLKEYLPRPGQARRVDGRNTSTGLDNQSFSPATPSSVHVVPGSRTNMARLHSYYKNGPPFISSKLARSNGPSSRKRPM